MHVAHAHRTLGAAVIAAVLALLALATGAAAQAPTPASLTFSHPRTIDNPYLPLTSRRRCEMRGSADDGTRERSVRTVLRTPRRFTIAGQRVDAVVLRDNSYEDGKLTESTFDYYAQADDGTVYYLGETARYLRGGKVVNRRGSWLYGRDTDVLGVAMPPSPQLGQLWRLEDVPGIAIESNRVEDAGLRERVAGKLYTNVIRVSAFVLPEGEVEQKLYAPGVGVLVTYGPDSRVRFAGCR